MKPEQFIREFGEKKAREVVEGATGIDFAYDTNDQVYMRCGDIQDGYSIDDYEDFLLLEDLKRLVESVDLIKKVGGIKKAKEMLELFEDRKGRSDNYMLLFRAAQDHESIYGGGE